MIHVRAVCPPDLTERTMALLSAEPCVLNLVLQTGGVRNPDGDAIECDVLTGAANEVLRGLRALGLEHDGSIVLDPVDMLPGPEPLGPRLGRPLRELAAGERTPARGRGQAGRVGGASRNSRIAKATSTITTVHTTTAVVG
ncbi:hypothetical protein [Streptomyces avermitilis]|uniref:hypothetical protein n=1 Tax=Streptomyces avermitilis TaxID=33903 RepID=UPI003F4D0FE5